MKKIKERRAFRLEECQRIYQMLELNKNIREIGTELCRHAGVISKYIRRNKHPYPGVWREMTYLEKAKYVYEKQKERQKRQVSNRGDKKPKDVWDYVHDKLVNSEWSPEKIAGRIKEYHPEYKISYQAIYDRTKKRGNEELKQYLYEKGKVRRQNVAGRRSRFKEGLPEKPSIHTRPESANLREEPGHLEIDSIVSCRSGKGALINIIDRMTRYIYPILVDDLKKETVRIAITKQFHSMPEYLRKTITVDNGTEFNDLFCLEKIFPGLKIYWCDPYRPQQRGSVERSNRDFRRFFPKGTDFSSITQNELRIVVKKINNTPLKLFKFKTPDEILCELPIAA